MKCGRSFGDRSNRLSHQKKCTATAMIHSDAPPTSPEGAKEDPRPVRALPERLAKIPANTQVIPNNNNTRYVAPDKIRRRRRRQATLPSEVYNDNAEEDDEGGDAGGGGATGDAAAGPQIVSVESVRTSDACGGGEGEDEDEEELEEEEIIVDPSTLTDLDYDDIIDDSVYDEDLEEIQVIIYMYL